MKTCSSIIIIAIVVTNITSCSNSSKTSDVTSDTVRNIKLNQFLTVMY